MNFARYGFNGMEKESEIANVEGGHYDFGARIYDSRLGRWLAVDPLAVKYPYLSPYNYSANNPIFYGDVNGEYFVIRIIDEKGAPHIFKVGEEYTGSDEAIGKAVADVNKMLDYLRQSENKHAQTVYNLFDQIENPVYIEYNPSNPEPYTSDQKAG